MTLEPGGPVDAASGVRLREPTAADSTGVLEVHGDPRVYEFDPQERHADLAMAERFLNPILHHWAEYRFGYWTVLVPPDWFPRGVPSPDPADGGRVNAGMGGIQHYTMVGEPVLNVYYRLAPEVHGRGVARFVIGTAADLAPTALPGADLVVRTRPGNIAARRVAERTGFQDLGLEPGTTDMQLLRLPAAAPTRRPD